MTSGLGRLYATALAVVVFFIAWAVVAARPWVPDDVKQDPRLVALNVREQRLHQDAIAIKKIVDKRWATYRVELDRRKHLIAVRVKLNAARAQAQAQAARQVHVYQQPSYRAPSYRAPSAPVVRVTPAAPTTHTKSS